MRGDSGLLVDRNPELRVKLPKHRRGKIWVRLSASISGVDVANWGNSAGDCGGMQCWTMDWVAGGRAWRVFICAGGWMVGVRAREEFMLAGRMDRKSAVDGKSDAG